MATIEENLVELQQTKQDIKTAIENKGQDLTDVPFTEYADKISAIQTGMIPEGEIELTENGNYDVTNYASAKVNVAGDKPDMLQQRVDETNSCAYLFYNYGGTNLDIKNLDTSKVTDMSAMFYGCKKLEKLDVSSFNTSNVTTMTNMFLQCLVVPTLDVTSFNTSNVTSMSGMFQQCQKLTELDVSTFNTSNVTSMSSMFSMSTNLETINGLNKFDTSKVTNMSQMFSACQKLTSVDLSSFDTSKVTNMYGMFSNCYLLKTIDNLDLISVTSASSTFDGCRDLENLSIKNIKLNLTIGGSNYNIGEYGRLLSNESLINTIKELWDYSSGTTTYKLTMSAMSKVNIANIYVKLVDVTEEMLAQDPYAGNKKPCVVCESTDEGAMTLTEYATSKKWAIA